MVEIFLERTLDAPIGRAELQGAAAGSLDCFGLHRVEWRGSLLALDGRKLVCHLRAPDAESVRMALRGGGADARSLWPGSIHDAPHAPPFTADAANVLVRRSFAAPVRLAEIQAQEDARAWCLEARQVKFVRSYFARDGKRMLCLYRAPDAESVREAQRMASMPMDDVWSFTIVLPKP